MKTISKLLSVMSVCLFMVAKVSATITNASWVFPVSTTPAPSQPIAADSASYSINNNLAWTEAISGLSEAFVSNPGNTTALEFSYNGNHSEYLNGSTMTLTSTISGLANGFALNGIGLSYDTKWNKTINSVTETWAYSLNGGAFLNFQTNAVTGNVWQTSASLFTGLKLQNGDTVVFLSTFSGATGNNGNLDFDNIQITSANIVAVPEPSSLTFAAVGISLATLRILRRLSSS